MQPLQYDLRCPAAKDNNVTHADAAPSNLDAAITMRSAETKLQNTKELTLQSAETELRNSRELRARMSPKRRLTSQFHCDLQRLSCKSQKTYVQKKWFRARLPSNSNCSSCETVAFVRDILQFPTVEDAKTKVSYETSFKFQRLKM